MLQINSEGIWDWITRKRIFSDFNILLDLVIFIGGEKLICWFLQYLMLIFFFSKLVCKKIIRGFKCCMKEFMIESQQNWLLVILMYCWTWTFLQGRGEMSISRKFGVNFFSKLVCRPIIGCFKYFRKVFVVESQQNWLLVILMCCWT